jgi:glycine/D-amino acid oxidase-like deaminating enzyme
LRGVKVTVIDQRNDLLPVTCDCDDGNIDPGIATSSSFGWLNANDKSLLSYRQFNHLGMEIWRQHNILKYAPVWCGSLVRAAKGDNGKTVTSSPHYLRVGPLTLEEARRLEPDIEWSDMQDSCTHFYPEEGHVDPLKAVKVLRSAARKNGVDFLGGMKAKNLKRDNTGKIVGVEYTAIHSTQPIAAYADVVVIAAGADSSNPDLGIRPENLQLLDRPGLLAYAMSSNKSKEDGQVLERIFVDTISQTHMLRRTDKTFVIGGGELVNGGKEESKHCSSNSKFPLKEEDDLIGQMMVKSAVKAMQPVELQSSLISDDRNGFNLVRVSRANRPMPSDGLPVLGYIEQGLYIAVTHSGITLGPLIGELAAFEICNHEGFTILDSYRPSQSRISPNLYFYS